MLIQVALCCLIALCSCENGDKFLESKKYSKGDAILWYMLQKLHLDDKRIGEIQKSIHKMQTSPNLPLERHPDNKNQVNDAFKKSIADLRTNIKLVRTKFKSASILNRNKIDLIISTQKNETVAISGLKKTISNLEKELRDLKQNLNVRNPLMKDGYIGCFQDNGKRQLKYRIKYFSDTTLLKCKQHCHGYKYVGLQDGSCCLCGNGPIDPSFPRIPDNRCNKPCPGEKFRMCGAGYINSLYRV